MAETIKSTTVVVNTGIAAAIRYGGLSSSGSPSYGAKLQISRIVVGSVEISSLNENTTTIPGIVWDSRNPSDNPLSPNGEVPMSFLNYQVISDKTMAFVVNLPESAGPFTVKTIGLYARDETGKDILFSVSQYSPAVDKVASTEETTGYSQSYWIFITMSGISGLFTDDGSSIIHPNPVQIQPVNNSYATIPQVVDETKLPVPATYSIYNLYYVEKITNYSAPGLAVRSGSTWNYILALKKDTLNSFPVTSSMLNGTESSFVNKVVYIDASGRFSINDGTHQPIGIYKDGRIYQANGYLDFEDSLGFELVPGATYYATDSGKFTKDLETDWIVGTALTKSTFYINFVDSRYATTTRKGLIQLATKEEVQDGKNDNKAVTPSTLSSILATQESPEQAINAYFGTIQRKNFSIRRVPRTTDNFFDIEVTAYLPRLLSGTGIKQEKVVKTFNLSWRRNPLNYPSGSKTSDTASWESIAIPLAGTWNYTEEGTSIKLTQSSQEIQELNKYNQVQIGDYIYVGGESGPDTVRQIIAINGSVSNPTGTVLSITVNNGLRQLPPNSVYYVLKAPTTNVANFYQYIKLYWKLVDGVPTVDFDYITSYQPTTTSKKWQLQDDWTDDLAYYIKGNLIKLDSGYKALQSEYPTFTNYCFGDYSRYKIGEVVTTSANPTYSYSDASNPNVLNANELVPPEPGMELAEGQTISEDSDFYNELGLLTLPNLRTYNKFSYRDSEPVALPNSGDWGKYSYRSITSFTLDCATVGSWNTSVANSVRNVYTGTALQNAVYFWFQPDCYGSEGCSLVVNNVIVVKKTLAETKGDQMWFRFYAEKGNSVEVNACCYGYGAGVLKVAYSQFQPGTVSWVKVNK